MRKIITALLPTCGLALGFQAIAATYPITPQQKATAEQVAQSGVPLSELAPNAPDSYTVKRGDTLWAISGLFLKSPWRWPELWGMNKDEIRNPHLIYPGQMLYLDKSGGRARLRMAQPVGPDGQGKLSPTVRSEALERAPIASIPYNVIEPFLSQPLVVDEAALKDAPRVMATQEGRVYLGLGDTAYVRGKLDDGTNSYQVYRPGRALVDPDDGKTVLGYEAYYVGTAAMEKAGDPATFRITQSKEEVGVGDKLVPAAATSFVNYTPRAPEGDLKARVMTIYGTVDTSQAGPNQIISLNKGRKDGMEVGHVFALYRAGEVVQDKTTARQGFLRQYEKVTLPDERYGLIFVFRVFDRVSYALVMEAAKPVKIGDKLLQP